MQTRSQAAVQGQSANPDPGYPELLACPYTYGYGHDDGASRLESQRSFLRLLKLGTVELPISYEEVLCQRESELLSIALSHEFYLEEGLGPYFTPEQWLRLQRERNELISSAEVLFLKMLNEPQSLNSEDTHGWLALKERISNLCECTLHSSEDGQSVDMFASVYSPLIQIQAPLSDDSGKQLAQILFVHIISKAKQNELVEAGSPLTISYVLRLPSGHEGLCVSDVYEGYCNFIIYPSYSAAQKRLNYPMCMRQRLLSTGEVQSPQGATSEAKTRTTAQAGQLASTPTAQAGQLASTPTAQAGQLASTPTAQAGQLASTPTGEKSMGSVIFFEDLTATLAMATLDSNSSTLENSVKYEILANVHYNLKVPEDMQKFAGKFISLLKYQQQAH